MSILADVVAANEKHRAFVREQIGRARSDAKVRDSLLKRWNEFKSTDLPALNRQLRESHIPEIELQRDIHHDETETDEE